MVVASLTDRDIAMLDFEGQWYATEGAKEKAIGERFGLSAVRYYQLLNQILDREAALAHDPVMVKRLHRVRDSRSVRRRSRIRPGAPESDRPW